MDAADILDLVLVALIGISILRGYMTGVLKPLFGILAVCLGAVAAWLLYVPVSKLIPWGDAEWQKEASACLIIFIAVVVVATLLLSRVWKGAKEGGLRTPDRWAGAAIGGFRICLMLSFMIRTLYFHPALVSLFQRSILTPVVLFMGFAMSLFVPTLVEQPDNDKALEVFLQRDLEIDISTIWKKSGMVYRTVRITGTQALADRGNLQTLLPTGPQWEIRQLPAAAPGRVTVEASAELEGPEQFTWSLSRLDWYEDSGLSRKTLHFEEHFHLPRYAALAEDVFMPERDPDADPWSSIRDAWAETQREIQGRIVDRLAETLAIPVHGRCRFPYPVEEASRGDTSSDGRTVSWDFQLSPQEPVTVTASAAGKGWLSWLGWAAGVIAVVSVMWLFRYRIASLLDAFVFRGENVDLDTDEPTGGALPD